MAEKIYYSMGEVTEMFDVEPSLIRYWCSQFTCLRPKRNAKGNRLFSAQDIERLKRIHHLLKEKKMTIEGAKKAMRKRNIEAEKNDSDIALLEQLQLLRAKLVDMRDNMGEPLPDEDVDESAVGNTQDELSMQQIADEVVAVAEQMVKRAVETVIEQSAKDTQVEETKEVSIEDIFEEKSDKATDVTETVVDVVTESVTEVAAETAEVVAPEPSKPAASKKKRAPRRKLIGEEGVVERPLFPFYEQTLF